MILSKNNPLISSLNQSFILIKKHKTIIITLLILQIIFLGLMLGLQAYYQTKSLEIAQDVMGYLDEQDLSDMAVAESLTMGSSLLGDDPLMIYRGYEQIAGFMLNLSIYSSLVYFVLQSLMWALTDQLVRKKNKKKFFSYIGKFCTLALGFIALISIFVYLGAKEIITSFISETSTSIISYIYLALALIVVYFMFISFASIARLKLKEILRKTITIGIEKGHIILLVYLIILVVVGLLGWLVYFLSEKNMILLLLSMILLVFSFVWSRILLITVVDKLKV